MSELSSRVLERTHLPFVKCALEYAFGLPAKAASLYDKDDSSDGPVPPLGSTVEARNRISYSDHQSLIRFLEGQGLSPFSRRFLNNITQQPHNLHNRTGSDGEYPTDLMKLVRDQTLISNLDALCGPYLLKENPHFLEDYWEFDGNLQTYLQGGALLKKIKQVNLANLPRREDFTPQGFGGGI